MMLSNKHRIVRITRASPSAHQPSKGVSRFVSDDFITIETTRLIAIHADGVVFIVHQTILTRFTDLLPTKVMHYLATLRESQQRIAC
jgi:hypothetical protein